MKQSATSDRILAKLSNFDEGFPFSKPVTRPHDVRSVRVTSLSHNNSNDISPSRIFEQLHQQQQPEYDDISHYYPAAEEGRRTNLSRNGPHIDGPRSVRIPILVQKTKDLKNRGISESMSPTLPLNFRPSVVDTGQYPEGAPSQLVYSTKIPIRGLGIAQSRSVAVNRAAPRLESSLPSQTDTSVTAVSLPRSPNVQDMKLLQSKSSVEPRVPYRALKGLSPVSPPSAIHDSADGKESEVDVLTDLLMQNMQISGNPDFFGMCAKCGCAIIGDSLGCTALDQLFHIDCFRCIHCERCLCGLSFYAMEGRPHCESCYMDTLEKCTVCSHPVTSRMLRATGKPYHPECFTCVVCSKNLDGLPFTIDAMNQVHCVEDFHKKFAPKCSACNQSIVPSSSQKEVVRIVSFGRNFHIDCYRCEDCGITLNADSDDQRCLQLDDHIFCRNCGARQLQGLNTKMTTEL